MKIVSVANRRKRQGTKRPRRLGWSEVMGEHDKKRVNRILVGLGAALLVATFFHYLIIDFPGEVIFFSGFITGSFFLAFGIVNRFSWKLWVKIPLAILLAGVIAYIYFGVYYVHLLFGGIGMILGFEKRPRRLRQKADSAVWVGCGGELMEGTG